MLLVFLAQLFPRFLSPLSILWLVCGVVLAVLFCDPKFPGRNSQLQGGALWTHWHTSTLQRKLPSAKPISYWHATFAIFNNPRKHLTPSYTTRRVRLWQCDSNPGLGEKENKHSGDTAVATGGDYPSKDRLRYGGFVINFHCFRVDSLWICQL